MVSGEYLKKTIFSNLKIKTSITGILSWGLIALGIVLRIRQFLSFRSLWLDEAMLALNIVNRDLAGLLKPLDYNQGAPIGFLFTEKLVTQVLGASDITLRLFPLAAGCAALILCYFLVKDFFHPAGILLSLALFAVNPNLIYYASEVKQYSSDVFIFLLLTWLAFGVVKGEQDKLRNTILLAAAGVIGPFFSHPAVFILAAIGMMLFVDKILQRDRAGTFLIIGTGLIWMVAFGFLYWINLRQLADNSFLLNYWQDSFSLNPLAGLQDLFRDPGGLASPQTGFLVIAIIGSIALFFRNWKTAGTFVLILLFTFIASWMQKYPFAGRLMLFSTPILFICLAASVDRISSLQIRPRIVFIAISTILAGWMLYFPFATSVSIFISPQYVEHIRPSMSYLRSKYEPNDVIYVYASTVPAFRYYAPFYGFADSSFIPGQEDGLPGFQNEVATLKSHTRIWLIFTHIPKRLSARRDAFLGYLNTIGELKDKYIKFGTNVYLYLYELK